MSFTYENYYTALYKARLKKNLNNISNDQYYDVISSDRTHAKELGLELRYVEWLRQSNPIFKRLYVTDPAKQNTAEDAFAWFMNKEHNLTVEKLPQSGKNALKISGGNIQKALEATSDVKSIDFTWADLILNKSAFALHKRTSNDGGAQGSVLKEVDKFMQLGRELIHNPLHNKKIVFAIADGDFFIGEHEKLNEKHGIPGRLICCNSDDVFDYWVAFLKS